MMKKKTATPLDKPELLLKAAAVLMRHRMLAEEPEPVSGGSPGWLKHIASRHTDDSRMKPWVFRAARRALEESRTVTREDAPPETVFEELVFAAGRARGCTRRAEIMLGALYDIVSMKKPGDEVLLSRSVRAACTNAIRTGRLPEPTPGQHGNGAERYQREAEECLETIHHALGTSELPGGRDRNVSTARALQNAARGILIRRGALPPPAAATPGPKVKTPPDDPRLRPPDEKRQWHRAELPKEWVTTAFNDDASGLDDDEEATARRTIHDRFTKNGYEITRVAGDDPDTPPTEPLEGRWEGRYAEGCTLEYLGYDPAVLEADLARGIHAYTADGAEYLLDMLTEKAAWLPCNWTSVITGGRWEHTPEDGDPWTDDIAVVLGPKGYEYWRQSDATHRPVRRLGAYPHVRTAIWNGRQVELTLWLVSTKPQAENRTRWPEKAPPLPIEIRAALDDLPFTCPMCGTTDETVPDPTTLEPDEPPICSTCTETIPGWGDAYESWPESRQLDSAIGAIRDVTAT